MTLTSALQCRRCGHQGPLDDFDKDNRQKTGRTNLCRVCKRAQTAAWKRAHPERVVELRREYKKRNRKSINERVRLYSQSPRQKLLKATRQRIYEGLKGLSNNKRSLELLGVATIEDYRLYLESLFELGMSWENYGNGSGCWNIDHKVPLFKFNLNDPNQLRRAFHFTNTRPMWQSENCTNGAIARWREESK